MLSKSVDEHWDQPLSGEFYPQNVLFRVTKLSPRLHQASCDGTGSSYGKRRRRRSPQGLVRNRRRGPLSSPPLQVEGREGVLRDGLVVSEDLDDDAIYHEMPLQKEIIVANTRIVPLKNGLLPEEEGTWYYLPLYYPVVILATTASDVCNNLCETWKILFRLQLKGIYVFRNPTHGTLDLHFLGSIDMHHHCHGYIPGKIVNIIFLVW